MLHALWLLLLCAVSSPATAASVTKLSWDSKSKYTRFIMQFDQPVKFKATDSIKTKGFYYVDVYGLSTTYRRKLLTINDDSLKYVNTECYPDHGVLRLVFFVQNKNSSYQINQVADPPRLVIDTVTDGTGHLGDIRISAKDVGDGKQSSGANTVALSPDGEMPRGSMGATADLTRIPGIPEPKIRAAGAKPGRKKYVIIDPGHGGENNGAVSHSRINGKIVQEKHVCLQFAYHLKKIIDASPNMVALLTRTDDSNVSLQDRINFAEANQGDFFISIHMNDGDGNPAARGMEIYYLNDKGKLTAAEKAVEERENKDVGKTVTRSDGKVPILKTIFTDLDKQTLETYQYESWIVCNRLHASMTRLPLFKQHTRGIKSANFVVLKNFSMPAVLLEVGFMTNSEDLKALVNPQFQQATAALVYNGLCDYFSENDPEFRPQKMDLATVAAAQ